MSMRAKDIMQTRVVTVGPDDPLLSVHRLFTDEEISGAPVVDNGRGVIGVITIRDLLREGRLDQEQDDRGISFYRQEIDLGVPPEWCSTERVFVERLSMKTAEDVMTAGVISVGPGADISEVVEKVVVNRIHRVFVQDPPQDGGALVGIISLFDLVALLA
jgi:CBS domain-containing protein